MSLHHEYAVYTLDEQKKVLRCQPMVPCVGVTEGQETFCIIPFPETPDEPPHIQYYAVQKAEAIPLHELLEGLPRPFQIKVQSREEYIQAIQKLKHHIQIGDIYEVNYCVELSAENISIDPLQVFLRLQRVACAPYARMVKLGEQYIISVSPELFLKREGRRLISKPIKGTAPRGKTEAQDQENKHLLYNSLKERTENVMIVDVTRNDFSKIAERGTVRVDQLYTIETYNTVHQMVSTVSCTLPAESKLENVIEALYPVPSITGAPKRRATELILQYETFRRAFYCGTMGFYSANGDFELSVIIRSIVYDALSQSISIGVGSAITHLCDPEKEYDECLLKAKALVNTLNAAIIQE